MKLNSSRDGIQTSLTKMVGIGDAYETSVAGSIYFYKPNYLAFDDSGQLLVANKERIEITVLDKDLNDFSSSAFFFFINISDLGF